MQIQTDRTKKTYSTPVVAAQAIDIGVFGDYCPLTMDDRRSNHEPPPPPKP